MLLTHWRRGPTPAANSRCCTRLGHSSARHGRRRSASSLAARPHPRRELTLLHSPRAFLGSAWPQALGFLTGGAAPPPPRTHAVALASGIPRLGMAAGARLPHWR